MSTNSVSYLFEAVDNMSRTLKGINKNVKGFGSELDTIVKKSARFRKGMRTAGEGLTSFGRQMRGVSIAATAMGIASVYAYSKLEKGIMNVQGLMNKEEIVKYTGTIKQLQSDALRAGFSMEDLNRALFDTPSAMGANEAAWKTFTVAQKLAIGGNADLGIAVDGLTSIINAYGKETTDAGRVAEAFYTAQVGGKTTVSELAASVGTVVPLAKMAGVSFQELLATMSALTLGGMKQDMATTALRGSLQALVRPGKEAQGLMDKMGISHGATAIRAKGLSKVLLEVVEASKKYPDMIARAIPNIRGFTGLMSLNAERVALVSKSMEAMNTNFEEGTGLQASFNRISKSTSQNLKRIKGDMTDVASVLGEDLSPYVSMLSSALSGLSNWFRELSPATRRMTVVFGGLVAAAAPAAIAIGALLKFFAGALVMKAVLVIGSIAFAIAGLAYAIERVATVITETNWKAGFMSLANATGGAALRAIPGFSVIGEQMGKYTQGLLTEGLQKNIPTVQSSNRVERGWGELDIYLKGNKDAVEKVGFESEGFDMNLGKNMSPVRGG